LRREFVSGQATKGVGEASKRGLKLRSRLADFQSGMISIDDRCGLSPLQLGK